MNLKFLFCFGVFLINFVQGLSVDSDFKENNLEETIFNLSNDEKPRIARQDSSQTCICVPPGSCAFSPNPNPNDGSGSINIRIVTSNTSQNTNSCNYGLVQCCQTGPYQCGVRYPPPPGSRAPVDDQAAFGAYPWQVALLTLSDVYLGSGALIDQRHVLTAAHKVSNIPTNSYKIRLGEWDASTTSEPIPAQDVAIVQVFVHPNFNSQNLFNDVALVRLATTIPLGATPTISTACLAFASFIGSICYVSGWGKNAFGPNGAYQAVQKQVDLVVRNTNDCQSLLAATTLGSGFTFNATSFICAGGEANKDACTGDGGSPLVCQSNNRWFVIGLVAWGIGCGTSNTPGVYVNVASYLSWIQATLAQQ